jgi:hypothetical protein
MFARLAKLVGFALATAVGEVGLATLCRDGHTIEKLSHYPPTTHNSSDSVINGIQPSLVGGSGFGFDGDFLELGLVDGHRGCPFVLSDCKCILPYEHIESQQKFIDLYELS